LVHTPAHPTGDHLKNTDFHSRLFSHLPRRNSSAQQVWTFAAGGAETYYLNYSCPCVDGSTNGPNIPAFVGQNYFCEAGVRTWNESQFFFRRSPVEWAGVWTNEQLLYLQLTTVVQSTVT